MFILLCSGRTGGSTLASLMRAHPDVEKVIGEPFNNYNPWWKHLDHAANVPVSNMRQLDGIKEFITTKFGDGLVPDGLKVMRYNIDPEIFLEWTERDNIQVVFLERRNLLRSLVSNVLAKRIKAWRKQQYPGDYQSQKMSAIPIDWIKTGIQWSRHVDNRHKIVLDRRDYLHAYYEDFYFNYGWKVLLPKIQSHLGYKPIITDGMKWLLSSQRINDERTYLNIENVYEIERECGNDNTGWLFDGPPLML